MFNAILKWFGYSKNIPEPQIITHKVYMNPLSQERLNWLFNRQSVLEPVIATLKTYMHKHAAAISSTQIQAALATTQTEFLINQAEIQVLSDFLEAQRNASTQQVLSKLP